MLRYASIVLKLRVPLAVLLFLLVGASIWALPHVRLDFSVFSLIEAGDEAKADIDQFYEYLPPRTIDTICLLEWPEVITRRELQEIQQLSTALEELPSVAQVTSLSTAYVIETSFGVPLPKTLMAIQSDEPLVDVVGSHPLLAGRLLSRDGRSAAFLVNRAATVEDPLAWIAELRATIEKNKPAEIVSVRFMAGEIFEDKLAGHMRHDMFQSVVLEILCFLVLMPILFGTLRATLIPLTVVGCSVLFSFGLMVLTGSSLSLIEVAIPGLITIIALCDAIHMMHRFEECRSAGRDKFTSILDMMKNVGGACMFTSLTTIIGFLSLLVVDNRAIDDFAVSAATGVGIAFLCVVTLMPLLLAFTPIRSTHGGMRHFVRIKYGRRRLTYVCFAGLALVSVWGISKIEIGSRWAEEFPADEPVVKDLLWYQENFNGYLNLDVKLQGKLDSVAAFRAVEQLEAAILEDDAITGAESYTHWVREWIGNPESDPIGPRISAGFMAVKLSGAADAFPEHVVTRDFRLGRIRFQMKDVGTGRVLAIIDRIDQEAANLPEGLTAKVAGFNRIAHENRHRIVVTMLKSLLVTTFSISILLMIIFRSFGLGLLAMVPNTLPILAALGLTGLLDIHLRTGIVMIYSLGVGLAVDNTIHLLTRFIHESRARPAGSIRQNMHRSLRTTGNALVASSAVLVLGSFCYLPSDFQSMSDVGVLLSTMVIVALLTELYLLPHLLERLGGKSAFGLRPRAKPRRRGSQIIASVEDAEEPPRTTPPNHRESES